MLPDQAALSSISSALDDLTRQVSTIAERHLGTDEERLVGDLLEVERALRSASRRLSQLLRHYGR